MRQAEDMAWSAVTESAKRRFDFSEFKKSLGVSGDDHTAEYILFQLIVGFAEKLSGEELASKIRSDLLLFGYSVLDDVLERLLVDKKEILKEEIRAAEAALSGFFQGKDSDAVFAQVRSLLL